MPSEQEPTNRFGSIANQFATIGADKPTHMAHEQTGSTQRRQNVLTAKRQDAKDMKRQTVYMPMELARWLKAYAATTDDDISGVINDLVEKFRNQVERR
jgi:hypothetical protein